MALGTALLTLAAGVELAPAAGTAALLQLGQNLTGESCHADGRPAPARTLEIMCGMSTDAMASLRVQTLADELPQDVSGRRETILRIAEGLAGSAGTTGQVICDGGQWPGETRTDNVLIICTLQANSWPRIIFATVAGRTLYEGDGLPAMLPPLQAAVAIATGRPFAPAELQASVAVLEAKLPAAIVRSSGKDLSDYKRFVELGRFYSGSNNYAGAETAYRSALDIETRLFGPDGIAVGQTLAELALQVSNQGRFDEAAALFRRAAPIIAAAPNVSVRARYASYLALDAANQRHFSDALKFARDATTLRRQEVDAASASNTGASGFPAPLPSQGELAHSLRIEAEMALRLEDLPAAQAAAEEALWIVSQEPGLPLWWRPEVVMLMAEINERQGRVVVAERDFLDARRLQQTLFGDSPPVALTDLRLGKFYADQQVYPASTAAFRAGFAILAKDPVARSQILPDQIAPFIAVAAALASDPLQRPGLDAEVFRATQFVRSNVADQTIARASARLAAGNSELSELMRQTELKQRERDNARVDLAAEYAKPDDERSPAREARLAGDLQLASAAADQMLATLQQVFPAYRQFAESAPAELSDVQKNLRPGEAFLSFVIGVKSSYALLVTPQGLTARQLDVTGEALSGDIADLRGALAPQLGQLPDFSLKTSYSLYTRLLGPFENQLRGVSHLIVAPGEELASLPFALLVTAPPPEGAEYSYSSAAWLIRRVSLSQVHSPLVFVSLSSARTNHVSAPKPFFGMGDPVFSGPAMSADAAGNTALAGLAQSCRESGPMAAEPLRALPRLSETADEVNAVAKMLGGAPEAVLLGADATEANLRSQALDQYAVLYFATHGLLPNELHCQTEPSLVFSPPANPANATQSDGLLEAGEIAGLKLNADLVVLSACNTATAGGRRFGGGALEGLASAFFNAGTRAVLASHWQVPSAATTRLMTGVFERVAQSQGPDLAEALRQSQLALIAQPATAHPFNWAAFTLIGDSNTLARTAQISGQQVQ